MLKFFQKYSFVSIYLTVFFLILLWINSFFNTTISQQVVEIHSYTPIYNWFQKGLIEYLFLSKLIVFFVFALQVFVIIQISLKYDVFDKSTFVGGFIYIVLSGFLFVQQLNPVIFANLFLLLGIQLLLYINSTQKSIFGSFNVALLFAIASFFYYPYVFLVIIGVISLIIVRSKLTKEVFVFLAGFIISYILYAELIYYFDGSLARLIDLQNFYLLKKFNVFSIRNIFFILPVLMFLISNIYILSKINTKEIEKRTFFQLFFSFYVFFVILMLFVRNDFLFISLFIPLSFLFGDYFANTKLSRFNKIWFVLFILNSVIYQYYVLFVMR